MSGRWIATALIFLVCGTLFATRGGAQFGAGAPMNINQYAVYDYSGSPGVSNTAGRKCWDGTNPPCATPAPTLISTDHVFLTAGQSHNVSVSSGATPYTIVNQTKVLNLNIYDGSVYQFANPALGASSGDNSNANNASNQSWHGQLGDQLITDSVYTKVIFADVGIGGTWVSDWGPSGNNNHRLLVALRWLRLYGMLAKTDMIFADGQADVSKPNPAFGCVASPCTTSAQYVATLQAMAASMRGTGWATGTNKIYVNRGACPFTYNGNAGGSFSGSTTSGTTLTIGTLVSGHLWAGDKVTANDGVNSINTTIVVQLTGTPGGSNGATYTIAAAAAPGNLTSTTVTGSAFQPCSNGTTYTNFNNIDIGQTSVIDNSVFFAGPAGHNTLCYVPGGGVGTCGVNGSGGTQSDFGPLAGDEHYATGGISKAGAQWCQLFRGSAC